jgi:hypothetical protein
MEALVATAFTAALGGSVALWPELRYWLRERRRTIPSRDPTAETREIEAGNSKTPVKT